MAPDAPRWPGRSYVLFKIVFLLFRDVGVSGDRYFGISGCRDIGIGEDRDIGIFGDRGILQDIRVSGDLEIRISVYRSVGPESFS